MDISLSTNTITLRVVMGSGMSLPITFQPAIQLNVSSEAGSLVHYDATIKQWVMDNLIWGNIGGDMSDQTDLSTKLQELEDIAAAGIVL